MYSNRYYHSRCSATRGLLSCLRGNEQETAKCDSHVDFFDRFRALCSPEYARRIAHCSPHCTHTARFALSRPHYTAESRYIERLRHTILVVERQPRLGADIPTTAVRGHDIEKQHVARASNDLHRCDALADGLQFGAQVSAELIALCSQTWKLVRRFFAGTAELE